MNDPNNRLGERYDINKLWRNKINQVREIAKEYNFPILDDYGFWANKPCVIISLILELWQDSVRRK